MPMLMLSGNLSLRLHTKIVNVHDMIFVIKYLKENVILIYLSDSNFSNFYFMAKMRSNTSVRDIYSFPFNLVLEIFGLPEICLL